MYLKVPAMEGNFQLIPVSIIKNDKHKYLFNSFQYIALGQIFHKCFTDF